MLVSLLKPVAAVLLVSLVAAFHAPLVAGVSGGMDCCAGGMTKMCCPLAGSCSLRGCGGDEREALLSTMSVFLLPGRVAALLLSPSALATPVEKPSPVTQAPRVLDPPPRG